MLKFDGRMISASQRLKFPVVVRLVERSSGKLIRKHAEVIGEDQVHFRFGPHASPHIAHSGSISTVAGLAHEFR
jgi:hypothetical protein